MNKTIEVMKAAMEKEKESMDKEKLDQEEVNTDKEPMDTIDEEEANIDIESMDTTDEDETVEGEDNEKKKSIKSKFKSSKSKEIEELTDRLMRSMAEFDNYRKRSEKEKSQMFTLGVKSLVEKLLPVIDNFERGLESIKEEDKEDSYVQGFEMIYKQLIGILEEIGVKPIEAIGKEFDPNYHNAVMHGEDEEYGENIVSEELQKGYIYNDIVVRHSMVKVVN